MKKQNLKKNIQTLKGTVISNKMDKTVVVEVIKMKQSLKYKKRYKVRKKYFAHDAKNQCKENDKVIIQLCRPLSKRKKWRVIKNPSVF